MDRTHKFPHVSSYFYYTLRGDIFDVKCLSVILGHFSVSMTLNRYVHPSMDLMHRNMAKLPYN